MGDTNPLGFYYKWKGLGLSRPEDIPLSQLESTLNYLAKLFHTYQRKKFSVLSPFMPIYLVKGNHDAEQGFYAAFHQMLREASLPQRLKLWPQPAWGLDKHEQNYFPLFFGPHSDMLGPFGSKKDDVMLMLMDGERYVTSVSNPEARTFDSGTLGAAQNQDIENLLKYTPEMRYKFFFMHRLLNGMMGGPNGDLAKPPYRRGLLATAEDFEKLKNMGFNINLGTIEQIGLTELLMQYNVNELIIGHDHIFSRRRATGENGKLNLMVAGSPKARGELNWYEGPYSELWRDFCGDHGGYGSSAGSRESDFWGPAGYVKLTISKDGIKREYIRSSNNHPYTNIPEKYLVGDKLPDKFHIEFPMKGSYGN